MPDVTCSVLESGTRCPRPAIARGWCNKHYVRWQRTGDPLGNRSRAGQYTFCAVVEDGRTCGERSVSKGMCRKHYSRFQRHGNPLVKGRRRFIYTDDAVADFWRLVDRNAPEECWRWQGTISVHGYGTWHKFPAHRYSYILEHGSVPHGLVVDHACHVPASCAGGPTCLHRRCVNPAHLKAIPHADNVSGDRSSNSRPLDDYCSIDGCKKPYVALDLCAGHYQRLREHGDAFPNRPLGERISMTCAVDDCEVIAVKRGWCDMHWKRWYRTGDPLTARKPGKRPQATHCTIDGCGRRIHAQTLCTGHYQRLLKHGDPLPDKPLLGA
ncbi:hypothetical protein [Streptosporangium sp. CA-115845]|uniref:hypothetical protein n=1 Tax=Streptosporangium sp. CA-115845 TaxID=3240071 RepID=UPI003D942CCB